MSIVVLKDAMTTFLDAEKAFEWGEGKETFKRLLKVNDLNDQDQMLFQGLLGILGIDPAGLDNIGQASYQDYQFKWFSFPIVSQIKTGEIALTIGTGKNAKHIPLVVDKKGKEIYLDTGSKKIPVMFDKGEYASQSNPNTKIAFPVLVLADSDPDSPYPIFHIRIQSNQKPDDVSKVDPQEIYYDHAKFIAAERAYDLATILKYVRPPFSSGAAVSLSYLFKDAFSKKVFPPQGIVIPITGANKASSQYGESVYAKVDFKSAFIAGAPYRELPEFVTYTGSKTKGFEEVKSSEVDSVILGSTQEACKQVLAQMANGVIPTPDKPLFLWVKGMGRGVDTVPDTMVLTQKIVQLHPVLKQSAPSKYLNGAVVKQAELVAVGEF